MGSDQTIKVCHLASGDLWAGAEVQVSIMCRHLAQRDDLDVRAIILNPGRLADELTAAGIPCTIIDESKHGFRELVDGVGRTLLDSPVDILHTHRYKENIIGAMVKRKCRIKRLVQTIHGMPEPFSGLVGLRAKVYGVLNSLAMRRFDMFVAVSYDIDEYMAKSWPDEKRTVVHNAVEADNTPPQRSREDVRAELGIPEDAVVVGSAGRMVPVKGYDLLLRAANRVMSDNPDVWLVLAGDGPLLDELKQTAVRYENGAKMILPGFRNDMTDVISSFDVLVMSSHHEGIPTVMLEAMAQGIPVVAMAVGGIPEVIEDGRSGVLVTAGSAEQLAMAVSDLLGDAPWLARIGRDGRARYTAEFTAEHQSGRLLKLYSRMLADR